MTDQEATPWHRRIACTVGCTRWRSTISFMC